MSRPRPVATGRGRKVRHNRWDLDPTTELAFDNATPRTDGGRRDGIAVIEHTASTPGLNSAHAAAACMSVRAVAVAGLSESLGSAASHRPRPFHQLKVACFLAATSRQAHIFRK